MRVWLLLAAVAVLCWSPVHAQDEDDGVADGARVQASAPNIVYRSRAGSDPALTSLDVYSTATLKNAPVLVYVHGGGWSRGDKKGVEEKPVRALAESFVFVSINYRLAPAVNAGDQAADIAAAVRWIRDNIGRHGGDGSKIILMGHSAGAHLAALTATSEPYLAGEGLTFAALKGVILLDGAAYDAGGKMNNARPRQRERLAATFGSDTSLWARYSPTVQAASAKGLPPFLILHVADRAESRAQSIALGEAIKRAGGTASVVAAPGKTHRTINREWGISGDAPTEASVAFMKGLLK